MKIGDSYTSKILHHRSSNVKMDRTFLLSDENEVTVEWDDFLRRIAGSYPSALLCNYVCRANIDEV